MDDDTLTVALEDAGKVLMVPAVTRFLASDFLRSYLLTNLQTQVNALGAIPNWKGTVFTGDERAAMSAHLQRRVDELVTFLKEGDLGAHPGALLKALVDQLMLYLIPLATTPSGVPFLGSVWKIRANGIDLQMWEGDEELVHVSSQRPPDIAVPERKLILPGQN